MSSRRSDTSRGAEPSKIDDLQLINGIGPVAERRLHGVGIYTYVQLAALLPADIAAAVAGIGGLTSERIIKQDWIGQALKLASKSISSEAEEGLEAPAEPVVAPFVSQVDPTALAAEKTEAVPKVVVVKGTPRLQQIETFSADTHTPQNCFPYSQPLDVRLTLDLGDVRVSSDTQFSYRASVYSKSMEGYPRQRVGETSGIVTSTDNFTVSVGGIVMPKGTYRLKAMVILNPMTTETTPQSGLVASKESDLLLIF
jgi:hypothetical protein